QAEDGIRDGHVTGVQTCALPICATRGFGPRSLRTSAHIRKNAPPANNALNTPERHQSSLSPCSQATSNIARPALAYKNPAKLGRSEERRVGKECRSRW